MSRMCPKAIDEDEMLVTVFTIDTFLKPHSLFSYSELTLGFIPCEVHTSRPASYVLVHTNLFITTHQIVKQSWTASNLVVDANLEQSYG